MISTEHPMEKTCVTAKSSSNEQITASRAAFPKFDRGYFHLTPRGWERVDSAPFPPDRSETWFYEMNCEAPDAKEQVTLARTWTNPDCDPAMLNHLHALFGEPVPPTSRRNVTLKCYA